MTTARRIGKGMFNWLFYGHIWVAGAAAGLSWLTGRLVRPLTGSGNLPLLVFFATLGVYTLHRLLSFRRADGVPDGLRYRLVARHSNTSLTIGIGSLLAATGMTVQLPWQHWWPLLPAAPLTFWYLTPLRAGGRRGRDLPYVKVLWVALAWTLVTGVFIYANAPWVPGTWLGRSLQDMNPTHVRIALYCTGLFCYVLAVALLFDFRDVALDRRQGVRTVANTKPGLAKGLAVGCFILSTLLLGILDLSIWLPLIVTLGCCLLVVRLTSEQRGEDFYAIWVNGLLVLLPGLVWLLWLISGVPR